jgi:four helix bundle protein
MIHAKSYRDPEVYKLSRELSKDIFDLSKTFPKEETYSLTDQIRRSSRSVGAQISEAWAKRRYEKHFVSKLTDADGELQETRHWLETSFDCKYIDKSILDNFLKKYESVGKMINSMINKSNLFCKENY